MQTSRNTMQTWDHSLGALAVNSFCQVFVAQALSGEGALGHASMSPFTIQALPHAFPSTLPEQGLRCQGTSSSWLLLGLLSLETLRRAAETFTLYRDLPLKTRSRKGAAREPGQGMGEWLQDW